MLADKRLNVRDIEVAYTESGEGELVVMVHGLAEDQGSFAALQNALPEFHTVAYAFRGHGNTSIGRADGTLAQLGEDLCALLEELGGPARCVGYSLGGMIVLWAAVHRPDLVRHVVTVGSSTVVGRAAVGFFEDRIQMILSDRDAFDTALRDDTAAQIRNPDADVGTVTLRRLEAIGDGAGYINAARAMIAIHREPFTGQLAGMECPVDVIGADGDVFCPRKAADIMLDQLGSARYHEIAGSGHLISVDQPAAYADVLRDILKRRVP